MYLNGICYIKWYFWREYSLLIDMFSHLNIFYSGSKVFVARMETSIPMASLSFSPSGQNLSASFSKRHIQQTH